MRERKRKREKAIERENKGDREREGERKRERYITLGDENAAIRTKRVGI